MLNEESLSKEKERMTELLTEEKINAFLRGSSTTFYDLTHSMYIEEFAKLNNDSSISSWAKKIGMVYSWIPGISSSAFDYQNRLEDMQTYADELTGLLKSLKNCNLEDCTLDYKNKTITCKLDANKNNTISFEHIQTLMGKLMHGNVNTNGQIATNSKMLHFSAPHLFPIMDTNICRVVFDKSGPRLNDYIKYMYLVQLFLNDEKLTKAVKHTPVSKLYVFDGVLFNEGR